MIFAKPTKHGAGIALYGDFHDFENLRETIYKLTDAPPLNGAFGDFVLGLAYEVRHACQGDREILTLPADISNTSSATYFGFRELWPVFLYQLGLLRWAAASNPTTKELQSNLFRLEACAENALASYDPFIGRRCIEWIATFQGPGQGYLLEYISNCCLQYVTLAKSGKKRFKNLPDILRMLSSSSKEYRLYEEHMQKIAIDEGCSPQELRDLEAWPEFKW